MIAAATQDNQDAITSDDFCLVAFKLIVADNGFGAAPIRRTKPAWYIMLDT